MSMGEVPAAETLRVMHRQPALVAEGAAMAGNAGPPCRFERTAIL